MVGKCSVRMDSYEVEETFVINFFGFGVWNGVTPLLYCSCTGCCMCALPYFALKSWVCGVKNVLLTILVLWCIFKSGWTCPDVVGNASHAAFTFVDQQQLKLHFLVEKKSFRYVALTTLWIRQTTVPSPASNSTYPSVPSIPVTPGSKR